MPLTELQKAMISEFYSYAPHRVCFNKKERNILWRTASAKKELDIKKVEVKCPALAHQIEKSYKNGGNIQSAVFSECVYAQTFAEMIGLDVFINCSESHNLIPASIEHLLNLHKLHPRYAYTNGDKSRILIQAGGCNAIDSALISANDLKICTIEFKEPGAKTSEPDLPKYGEDGNLVITEDFLGRYPQFAQMLEEQKDLNFFKKMGRNENNFSVESVNVAVSNNYTKKYADMVCTEDVDGYLVMIPADQISLWAKIGGEIRPAGRNAYKVWTPNALEKIIREKTGTIEGKRATIDRSQLRVRKERGGDGKVSGYKINPLFFVYAHDCIECGNSVKFDLDKVRQLNPTIAGKMFFDGLKYDTVKGYYCGEHTEII